MLQVGIDFGGTKIEAAALDQAGRFLLRRRTPNPGAYDDAIEAVCGLVAAIRAELGCACTIGIGVPGSVSFKTGLMRNGNSTYLNGRPFREDLAAALGQEIRLANDANCFALSESADGAAAGAHITAGVILGTGCGGGVVVDGSLVEGCNGITGEWGHMPLPWPTPSEYPGPVCWRGRVGCLEPWISGTGFRRAYAASTGCDLRGEEIVARYRSGDTDAAKAFELYLDRLARGLSVIGAVIDPDVFVLGGGMSNIDEICELLPPLLSKYFFSDTCSTRIVKAKWGDSSGVRGAARLWPAHFSD